MSDFKATLQKHYAHWRPIVLDRGYEYMLLTRFHKPIGSLLLGWPALWALWLAAEGVPSLGILAIFVIGIFLMRSAGCVINDYADRKIDPHVERTKDRPIAAGRVTPKEALILFGVLIALAFILVLQLNELTIYFSFGAALFATIYPFTKRFTYLPQAFLGIAFAFAIPMAWAAQTGEVPKVSWLLFIIVILWAMAYDTMYAMADREEDLKIGVKSTAILFGEADKLIVGVIQVCVLLGLMMLGEQMKMQWPYYLGLIWATGFSIYQQYMIRNREPKICFQAFLNNNWFGASVFAGIVLNYLIT